MNKAELTQIILESKADKGLTWAAIAEATGLSKEFTVSACLGMNSLKPDYAAKLCNILDLPAGSAAVLESFPNKKWDQTVPTDPLIYRFYEIVGVYGETIKEIIHEQFGDGIMSAIDYSMDISKIEDPKGDRVQVVLNGKFLPYRSW